MTKTSVGFALLVTLSFQFAVLPASSHASLIQERFVGVRAQSTPMVSKSKISDNRTAKKNDKEAKVKKKKKNQTYKDYKYDPNRPDIIPPVRKHKKSEVFS